MIERLLKTVVIGWSDISIAGCRALLGSALKQSRLVVGTFDVHQLNSLIKLEGEDLPALCIAQNEQEEVSLVTITSSLNNGAATHVFDGLLHLCRGSNVKEIVIVAALPIKLKSVLDSEVLQIAINCQGVDSVKSLPQDFLVKDQTLNMLIQFLQVEGIPTRCFVTQGYKIKSGKPNDKDGSKQSIKNIQNILHSLYHIDFDEEKTEELEYAEKEERKSPNLMYL